MASRVMARVPSSNGTPCAEVLDGKTYAVKLIRRPSLLDTVNMTAYAALHAPRIALISLHLTSSKLL